jgi:hypothetical protein
VSALTDGGVEKPESSQLYDVEEIVVSAPIPSATIVLDELKTNTALKCGVPLGLDAAILQ